MGEAETGSVLERAFEKAGLGVAHIGLNRRFARVSPRLCEILGYPEHELLRLTGKDISHPEDADVINQQRTRLYAGEIDAVRVEKRYLRKDRSVVWVSFTMVLERAADGTPQYEIAVYDDITARKTTEEALREGEKRFRRTFEMAGAGLAQVSLDGRFMRVNPRVCEILGYGEKELIGRTVKELSHPEDRDAADAQRDRVLRGEADSARLEKRYLRKDGAVVWVSLVIAVERDAAGRPLHAISVLDDITGRKRTEAALQESEALFRSTFELAASGIAHVSLEGRFMRVNRQLCGILRYREDELIGRSVKEVSHPEDRDVTDAQRLKVHAGERQSVRFEKRYLRKDGSTVWVSLGVALVRGDGGAPLYEIAMFDDITERKQAEAALHEAHEELKRSNSELEQFAYVASHDLQEPLRMVSSYTQLLGRRYGEKFDADAKEFMGYIVDGAARMKQLIEDLLAYSRVGTKGKDFRPVELDRALRRALGNLKAAIAESGASVTHDPLPTLPADEVQLAQLFQNLIGNALKFRADAAPRIRVQVSEKDKFFEFAVRDNGIGIEPQYFERIFMVFQRLHNKGEYPGTGIGLAICKKVVERHGGQIRVESRPGEGSAFIFTLPKERA
ncbi:MAG TPA: PAS domain S-box protein, partial [Burkholderiales bacterium]